MNLSKKWSITAFIGSQIIALASVLTNLSDKYRK
jgi:hypothetical protein